MHGIAMMLVSANSVYVCDRMDSYVLAETFKYLYLLFSERENLVLDVDEFVFTTEAHLLPLTLSMQTHPNASATQVPSGNK